MTNTFNGINALAFMAALLVLGVARRSRFAFLQRGLLPASLIGGAPAYRRLHAGRRRSSGKHRDIQADRARVRPSTARYEAIQSGDGWQPALAGSDARALSFDDIATLDHA